LPRKYVQTTAFPDWWDDEIARNQSGLAQAILFLARHLGIDPKTLLSETEKAALRALPACRFKKRSDATEDHVELATSIAASASKLAACAMSDIPLQSVESAASIRRTVLETGAPWVGLEELLDFCWVSGIAVLHLDHFPEGSRRPDGFATKVGNRPVIVICRHASHASKLLFILAHELGHLALGHVEDDGAIVDVKVKPESTDKDEEAANRFAIELLTGSPKTAFRASGRWPNAHQLALEAQRIGRLQKIDPGHVALNYGFSMSKSFFAVATAALNLLYPKDTPIPLLRKKMAENLDWSKLPEDSSEFLMRVTMPSRQI
jgi:Zn-dependent peptidase ImmA (M78 family)